ncbi:hypothetical protein M2L39_000169 [Staphylococcus pseudintermedius]|uniref:hypothetical protein n=1 Tax=Staphylococcus pseudintermedius TaxID=283734 RepID=UPI0019EF300F|nr:hypothetical protein [Staphylococcus pseudintermedius]EGQ3665789.1 hypothetical protein [Staphylococcus pseudintermedius]EGQ3847471.1 hypothetical protein [Staphylococcus pseudintermedius]EIA5779692.1 hypothetical protein [Staphylococcus pseudintermedius]EJD5774282.1 hypothetical protein [Staphylococcus pseudintermedius]MDT0943561.1 hypothetical protein [Staphylococcus pseudintermedius]
MKKNIKRKLNKLLLYFAIVLFCFIGQINANEGNLAGVVWDIFMIVISLIALQLTNDKSTREDV